MPIFTSGVLRISQTGYLTNAMTSLKYWTLGLVNKYFLIALQCYQIPENRQHELVQSFSHFAQNDIKFCISCLNHSLTLFNFFDKFPVVGGLVFNGKCRFATVQNNVI